MKDNEQHNSPEPVETPQLGVFDVVHSGLIVKVSPFLPIDETVEVCDVEAKRQFRLATGKYIDSVKMGNTLFVSKRVYEAII